ncbi:hypothetical protein [Clostridium sp. ZBS18]|uniref:hypothetical protein n=1 Tax=Clostridium sp. ZBS18 TaxID=2949967 RepID=UPI00207A837B|nr:hypothetical protein [Clostridium sp. ZBS18]
MKLWSFINEKKLAENLIKNHKLINDSPRDYIIAYIKYLKNESKYSKNKIRNLLDEFLIRNLSGFIVADWEDKLQRWVNRYSQSKYCRYKEGKNIKITQDELKKIKEVGDINGIKAIEVEKILFIMLVLAKSTYSEGKDLWCNYSSKDIFKLARYKYKTRTLKNNLQREYLLYDIKDTTKDKYISFGGENIKLLFKNDKSDVILDLQLDENNIENIILEYLKWRKLEDYRYCSVCGKEIKQKSDKPKMYCTKCARVKNIEKTIKNKKV